jgi:hypothetical protein
VHGSITELASDSIQFPADILEMLRIEFSGLASLYSSRSEAGVGSRRTSGTQAECVGKLPETVTTRLVQTATNSRHRSRGLTGYVRR